MPMTKSSLMSMTPWTLRQRRKREKRKKRKKRRTE
jgi:hypothetical protein